MGQEEFYDARFGDPKYEADDDREVERERAERDEWLLMVARQLEAGAPTYAHDALAALAVGENATEGET